MGIQVGRHLLVSSEKHAIPSQSDPRAEIRTCSGSRYITEQPPLMAEPRMPPPAPEMSAEVDAELVRRDIGPMRLQRSWTCSRASLALNLIAVYEPKIVCRDVLWWCQWRLLVETVAGYRGEVASASRWSCVSSSFECFLPFGGKRLGRLGGGKWVTKGGPIPYVGSVYF